MVQVGLYQQSTLMYIMMDGNSGMRRRMEDIPLLLFANGVELKLY